MKHAMTVTAVALVLAAAAVSGGAVITISDDDGTAPTANVVVSQTSDDASADYIKYKPGATRRYIGQTFTAPKDFVLDKITVRHKDGNGWAAGEDMRIYLYHDDGDGVPIPDPPYPDDGSALIDDIGAMPSDAALAAGDYVTFDVTNISLTSGQTYGFFFDWDTEDDTHRFGMLQSGSTNPYTGGALWKASESSDSSSRDLVFYVIEAEIPEPATLGLLLAGGVATILRRRKRA